MRTRAPGAVVPSARAVRNHIYVQADFGAKADGTTDDSVAVNAAIAAVNTLRGDILVFESGVYLVPDGVSESKQGLVAIGLGATSEGPSEQGTQIGAVIKATTNGAWTWSKQPSSGNDYWGGRFEHITFQGDADTAGGLRIRSSYVTVFRCEAVGHTTGTGFLITPPTTGDSAQVNQLLWCGAENSLTGFQVDDLCNTMLQGCWTMKPSGGGIQHTGTGMVILDTATQILGGKMEDNATGISLQGLFTSVIGTAFENNTLDLDLARASGSAVTGHVIVAPTMATATVGANNYGDTIIGLSNYPRTLTQSGFGTVCISNGYVKVHHVGNNVPSGGDSGAIKMADGYLWANDAGTWKRVAITAP